MAPAGTAASGRIAAALVAALVTRSATAQQPSAWLSALGGVDSLELSLRTLPLLPLTRTFPPLVGGPCKFDFGNSSFDLTPFQAQN